MNSQAGTLLSRSITSRIAKIRMDDGTAKIAYIPTTLDPADGTKVLVKDYEDSKLSIIVAYENEAL